MPTDQELLDQRVRQLRVDRIAHELIAEETRETVALSRTRMPGWLEEDDEPLDWRIQDLHQVGDNTTLAAAYKTGKSTMFTNMIRSLADGTPFLREKAVIPVTGTIYYMNLEVGERRMRHWLRRLNIKNSQLVVPDNLRGVRLPLSDRQFQDELIEHLKSIECEVWMIDPMGRILTSWPGFNGRENNNDVMREVGEVLDRIKSEAGVQDLFVATHTGRSGEHTRGATVTDDWPDALWHMTKRQVIEGEPQTRFFWAEGRDVELEEVGLGFSAESGETWIEPNIQSIQLEGKAAAVVKALIVADRALNLTEMRAALSGDTKAKDEAIASAASRRWIAVEKGKATMHRLCRDNVEVKDMIQRIKGVEL
jgi:hypothetical protein